MGGNKNWISPPSVWGGNFGGETEIFGGELAKIGVPPQNVWGGTSNFGVFPLKFGGEPKSFPPKSDEVGGNMVSPPNVGGKLGGEIFSLGGKFEVLFPPCRGGGMDNYA